MADDGARLVASTMGLIKGEDAIVFVDPGMTPNRESILDALDALEVEPEDVTHAFVSHHHPDHTVNLGLFPNATVVDFYATYTDNLWEDHPDNWEIDDGITVIRPPGHTHEDASLSITTPGGNVVFTHVWWTEAFFPPVDPLAESQADLDNSRVIVLDTADCIIPGHGSPVANPNKEGANCDMVGTPPVDDDDDDDDDDE